MMRPLLATVLVTTALFAQPVLAEDAAKPADTAAATKPAETSKDYAVIKFGNNESILYSEVMNVWKGLFPGDTPPDFSSFDEKVRQNILRGLVSEKLIYQEALKAGVDKDEQVKQRIANMQKQVVMQSFMEGKAKGMVNDAQLKAAYDEKAGAVKGQEEVKARHILVASEEEAKKIAADLKKGGDFDKIAKEKSTDKGSGARGGDLGWFSKDRMVPEFGEAAFKLKKGETSEPVKSQFGWHIIKLEDRRPLQIASFDEMKESLRGEISNKAVQSYIEGLLKAANVKYFGEDGKEKPFSSSLAPAASGEEKQ